MSIETSPLSGIHVRVWSPEDWESFKAIRLEALQSDPGFFGVPYAHELKFPESEWRRRLSDPHAAIWGLYDSNECIGLTGILQKNDNAQETVLIASYIRKDYRKKGLSALLYQARIDWARERGYKVVNISHRATNQASKAANQKFGFQYTHTESFVWPDGNTDDKLCYKLFI